MRSEATPWLVKNVVRPMTSQKVLIHAHQNVNIAVSTRSYPPFSFFKNDNFRKMTFRVSIAMVGMPLTKTDNERLPGLKTRPQDLLVGRWRAREARKQEEKLGFIKNQRRKRSKCVQKITLTKGKPWLTWREPKYVYYTWKRDSTKLNRPQNCY